MSYIIKDTGPNSKTLYAIKARECYYSSVVTKTEEPICTIKRIVLPYHTHERYELSWAKPRGDYKNLVPYGSKESDLWSVLFSEEMLEWVKPIKKPVFEKVHISGSRKKITFYCGNKYITFLGHAETTPKFVEKILLYAHYGKLIEHCLKLNKSFCGEVNHEQWNKWNEELSRWSHCESLFNLEETHIAFNQVSYNEETPILLG